MSLSFPVGRLSQGELCSVDIASTPHLFITYSEGWQLDACLQQIARLDTQQQQVQLYLWLQQKRQAFFPDDDFYKYVVHRYVSDAPSAGTVKQRTDFLKFLHQVFSKRAKFILPRQHQPILAVVDSIWELLLRLPRRSSLQFLQLLVQGHQQGIHLVMASPTSYRNLLGQVMQLSPAHKRLLEQAGLTFRTAGITPVGAELIFTPEDMVFFKQRNSMEVERYYKL